MINNENWGWYKSEFCNEHWRDRPQNIDFDCTFNFIMKVNQYVSTNLIFQFVYDDNEIKRVQVREVLGVGLNIDLSKIRI